MSEPTLHFSRDEFVSRLAKTRVAMATGDTTVFGPGMTFHFMPALWQTDWDRRRLRTIGQRSPQTLREGVARSLFAVFAIVLPLVLAKRRRGAVSSPVELNR